MACGMLGYLYISMHFRTRIFFLKSALMQILKINEDNRTQNFRNASVKAECASTCTRRISKYNARAMQSVYSHRGARRECDHRGVVAEVKETRNIPVTLQTAWNTSC
ncbi:hypothetical protein CDAR_564751 [Caerostris darwini]|uniref:Uncharacterized protein n=1 Tax=Caerostris darwini TaxID=1538125 RepID=A0AAV4SA54_9ARAC|nr:hypothetical protein CDAR_564751 [Caerostris darwini]